MSKLKIYLIIFGILIFFGMSVSIKVMVKRDRKQREEIARVQLNNIQLMGENRQQTNLFLTQREITGKLLHERDSLSRALKIRPRQIEKIIYIDVLTRDTIRVNVPVTIAGPDKWKINDEGECFKWAANAFKQGDSLKVQRTYFEYDNKTTQVFYKRAPHIWFIRTGRWQYLQEISSTCGGVIEKSFTFLKK